MSLISPTRGKRRIAAVLAVLSLIAGLLVTVLTTGPAGAATCGTTNIALGKAATASSLENASFPASG